MKNKNIAAAVFAAIGAVAGMGLGLANAEDVNFDGRNGAAFISAASIKADRLAEFQTPEAAAAPAQSGARSELKINTIVKSAGKTLKETLTCQPGLGADQISDCKKSDSAALTYQDMNTLALRQYFSPETLKFADLLSQTKHSYTNQSGPMTFSCVDSCANWELVEIHYSLNNLFDNHFERKCVEWTHECDCIAGC